MDNFKQLIGSILIKIEPGRILMRNPGRMLVSVEEYYAGSRSKCRNPLLQNMFRFLGFGEKAGSGADIIAQGWAENHWARPTISETLIPGETELVLTLQKKQEETTGSTTRKTTRKTTRRTTQRTTQKDILEYIRLNPFATRETIAAHFSITPDGVKYHTTSLQKKGILRREGRNGGHWEILK